MIDQHAYQCNRRRSLVIWRGKQWSVTSSGVETTDSTVPHVVIATKDLSAPLDVLTRRYTPLAQSRAAWLDRDDLKRALSQAKVIHQQKPSALRLIA